MTPHNYMPSAQAAKLKNELSALNETLLEIKHLLQQAQPDRLAELQAKLEQQQNEHLAAWDELSGEFASAKKNYQALLDGLSRQGGA